MGPVHGPILQGFRNGEEERQGRGLPDVAQQHGPDGGDGHEQAHPHPRPPLADHELPEGAGDERPPASNERYPVANEGSGGGDRVV